LAGALADEVAALVDALVAAPQPDEEEATGGRHA
jgi:hypothetical protein